MNYQALVCVALGLVITSVPARAGEPVVTFSGTVTYSGPYSGDTLWVAVIDTTSEKDRSFLDVRPYPVGPPPLSVFFSMTFPSGSAPPLVIVAAVLDVDGGGVDSISAGDIVGWYAGSADPTGVSPAVSQSGLDFELPRAEVHGSITLASGQNEAWIEATQDVACRNVGFRRPPVIVTSTGPYFIKGLYSGTYCVYAEANIPNVSFVRVCCGDPNCVNPTPFTLNEDQIQTQVDLDFTGHTRALPASWGHLKSRY